MQRGFGCRRAFARLAPALLIGVPLAGTIGVTATWALDGPTAALPPVPVPAENPITEEKRILGKMLFWDEQLSTDGTTACGSCHIPGVGGIDPRAALHPGRDGRFNTDDDITGSPGVVASDANETRSSASAPRSPIEPPLPPSWRCTPSGSSGTAAQVRSFSTPRPARS